MYNCDESIFINNDVCGEYDMLPPERENGFRMYFNHKSHIKLESAVNVKRTLNRGGELIYELEFPDTEYTYWASSQDLQEINMTIEMLIPRLKNKRKYELITVQQEDNCKKYEFRKFFVSLLRDIRKVKNIAMLDTLPGLDEYEYTPKNIYKCIADRNFDCHNGCQCKRRAFNDMLVNKLPQIYNCFEDCPLVQAKIECVNNHLPYSFCDNMFFTMRKYSQVYIFESENKGFGVKSKHYILNGNFIVDYCGEVYDNKMTKKMLENPENKKKMGTFFQRLSDNNVVCSYNMGNISRFINHSCQPNAKIERWVSGSRYVLGIFALTAIDQNEEITLDYGYEEFDNVGEQCLCGKPLCRGNIGYFSADNLPDIVGVDNPQNLFDITGKTIAIASDSHEVISRLPLPEASKEFIHMELCAASSEFIE